MHLQKDQIALNCLCALLTRGNHSQRRHGRSHDYVRVAAEAYDIAEAFLYEARNRINRKYRQLAKNTGTHTYKTGIVGEVFAAYPSRKQQCD